MHKGEQGDEGVQGERGPRGHVFNSPIILIVAVASMLLNAGTIGYLGWYVQSTADKSAERRANICQVAEQGDQNVLNLLINASPNADPAAVAAARQFIHDGFMNCAKGDPSK